MIRHIAKSAHIISPWKNGQGRTAELARHPQAESQGPFIWRISIADVETSGPFSHFETYDRHIMLLNGHGMKLDAGPHGILPLDTPLAQQSFPGEWSINGILNDGPVQDFNLMVARDKAQGQLHSMKANPDHRFSCKPHSMQLIYDVETGDSWLADETITTTSHSTFIIATITPHSGLKEGP